MSNIKQVIQLISKTGAIYHYHGKKMISENYFLSDGFIFNSLGKITFGSSYSRQLEEHYFYNSWPPISNSYFMNIFVNLATLT